MPFCSILAWFMGSVHITFAVTGSHVSGKQRNQRRNFLRSDIKKEKRKRKKGQCGVHNLYVEPGSQYVALGSRTSPGDLAGIASVTGRFLLSLDERCWNCWLVRKQTPKRKKPPAPRHLVSLLTSWMDSRLL
ncbi:hypothetical protein BX600DRAFT_5910 [Xylariales sp. PMI_506]|nr:hypothetical protein BX600DRAFT_5910 [Xylariales sp. PMI_506]